MLTVCESDKGFLQRTGKDIVNRVYVLQVVRSSSSTGANYIEANEKLGKQDLLMKLRIARKEAKETCYWLELLEYPGSEKLKGEADELRRILFAIISKIQQKQALG